MPKNFSFFAQTHCHHVQYVNILATLCPSCLCSTVSLTYNLPDSALSTGLLFCVSFLNYLISSIRLSSLEQESFLTGKDIQFRRSKTWCHPPHPSSTSGTQLQPPSTSPTFPVFPEPKKKMCRSFQYLPPSPHPHNHYVFDWCRKTPCTNFSCLVP